MSDAGFGDWFTMRRRRRGTQAQIAREIGTTKDEVASWERGTPPDAALARPIATCLRIGEDEVLGEIARAHARLRA